MDFMSPMLDGLLNKSTGGSSTIVVVNGNAVYGLKIRVHLTENYDSSSLSSDNALWRLVGLVSSVVALLCYAQCPSFNRLIGGWNAVKFSDLYGLFSFSIFTTILFVKQFSPSTRYAQIKTYTSFSSANSLWRLVGLVSSVVGLLCYAQSPSFNRLIEKWKIVKFILYGVFSLTSLTTVSIVKQFSPSRQYVKLKTYASFAVLMIISVYSFYYDKALNGKPEILSIVSNTAFALMSLSLSKLIKFGFEIGIFAYFLGCLAVQLWTINWMLILIAIIFGCPLFVMHSSSHSQDQVDTDQIIDESSSSDADVGNTGQPDVGNRSEVIIESYSDFHQEVSSEGQVIHSSVTIPEVASCGSDQGVDIILEENSVNVVAS